ncbi:mucin-17-like [Chionomys nivalis]|uniref:mucin-17-like n=1 Tax=Chionomys nivalis TaxID=269649 RepID=UPI00259802C4|nr:mucin-17-like [Chionomys nivalis]
MAKPVKRGQRASAGPSHSDQRPQFSQLPRPGTPFSGPRPGSPFWVPQWDDDILSQWGKHLPHRPGTPFRGRRPGTPYSVSQETYLTSTKFPRDFAPPGVLRLTRHKFRCQKPYEDKTVKIPYTGTSGSLRSLRALIKTTSSKKTLDPLKDLKEIKERQVPLPPEVPDCRSNPLSREPRPSALPPATRKRVASTSVHRPGKVQRSLDMSTVFEEPMDFDHSGTRVSVTSPRHCAGDASEKVNEDDRAPGPSPADSSTDQRGLVISPQFQGSLQPSSPTQGALGSSTSSQDAQGLFLFTGEVLGGTRCDQGSMGHSISSQASQKPPPFAERKIKHVSLSRRVFKSPSSSRGVTNHSNSPPKSFRQAPSDQGDLQQAPLDKESSKCFSPKGVLSDFSFSQNEMCPNPSHQGSLTPLKAAKDDWRAIPSHEESQSCFPSPQNNPKQSISAEVSLSAASSDQGYFITSPLKQEGFQCPPPENGLASSRTAQGGQSLITTPQVDLTPLIPIQTETKLSPSTSGIPEPLPSSEGDLDSSTYLQEMLGTPKSTQGTRVPSQHTQRSLAPASTTLGVLSPSVSVKRAPELSTFREVGERPILSHKGKFKPNPDMKMDNGYSHYNKKRRTDPPSEQGGFPVSLSDQEGCKCTLPIKKALLIRHWKQNSQRYAKRVQVRHACSTTTQGAKTIQPSLLPQGSLGLSTCAGEALEISTYTPGLPSHLQRVQHVLGSTIRDKGTVEQDTSAEGVPDSSPSLEMALGCDTCTQEFVANFTLREEDYSDSTCPQTPTGPLHSSQEAVEISPSPQGYQQSVTTTQEAIGHSPSAQRDISLSTCPQVTPEHPTNTPKVLDSTLSSQGPWEPVLSNHLPLEPTISIQKSLLHYSPDESVPETSTFTQGGLVTSLAAHEDFRPTTYAQETLEDTTPTQVLEISPHSDAVVKEHTCTPDTVAPSPSVKEAQRSTISGEGTLPSSPSTQESFMCIPSQEGNIKHVSSTQVGPGCSISTKKRLRDEPSDEGDFGTSSSEEGSFILLPSSKRVCASSTAPKETSITTSTPQVSPTPSISVQKAPQCSTSEQRTVEHCHSNQGPREHFISSQEAQGPSLSFPKGLCHLPSVPGLQEHSPSLSKAPENSTYTQGDLSISKSDLGALKPSLSAKGSKGKPKHKQKLLETLPLAQEDLTSPMSSKPSKDPYASSCLLAAEHFPSPPGSLASSTSEQCYLGTSPSCQGFLGHSPSAPGDMCCFQAAQGAKELLPSAQGPQESFPPSLSYSRHLPNLPGDLEDSSLERGILEHVRPAQGSLETSCSPRVSLQRPLLSLQRPLDLSISTQGNAGTSQSEQGLQRFLPSIHKYLENSPSAFAPLEHLPVAPNAQGFSTLSQETPSQLLPVHGILELPQYGSVALPSMPSVQGLKGSLSSSECTIAPVISVQGSVGLSLSAQEPIEFSKSTKAIPGHSLSALDDVSPFISSQETLGLLSSVEVDVGTYSHNTGSPGQLKNISMFPGSMISDHDPVVISLPAQGTLRHLPSAQEDVGLSLSAQQAPELSTLEQGSIQHVEAAKVALVNPSSPKGASGKLEHFPPSEGALEHSSIHQGTQESLKSSLESLEILTSNSKHVKNSLSAVGSLESSLCGPRVLGHMLADKHPEQHSIYAQGSLGNSLSTQEAQEHLEPLMGNLTPCQSAKEGLKTFIPSQIVLESAPNISEGLGALSSALEHMGLSSVANESLENSQYAESVVESSSSATGALRTTFAQKSLENSLPGKGIRETSSSQGALKILSSTKGRVENISSPDRSVKPPTSLQEALRPSSLIQGPHQHPLSAQGPLGPPQTDSGIQGPLSTPEAGGNLSREPGSWKTCTMTPETLDNLQSAEGPDDLSISAHDMFDPLPHNQGALGILVYSPGLMEPSESEHRKLGHVSSVGKDGEISPFENPAKSTSSSTPYVPFITEVLESSSCGLGSLGSLLSTREDAKGTPSAPLAQEPSLSTSQALEYFVTTQGALQINTCDEQTLCLLPSTVENVEHSTFSRGFPRRSQILPNVLDHLSSSREYEEFSLSAPGTKNISLLVREPLEHSSLQNATQATPPCLQEVVGSLLSEQGSLEMSSSDHSSLGPLAPTLGAGGPSLSEADSIQLSASAQVNKAHLTSSLGRSASKYYEPMMVGVLPALHGDLESSQSDQRTLEMTKFAEGALENLSVAQRTTKLSTHSQDANKSSLSDQSHLLYSPCVKEALIPALSDQETEESLLSSSEDTEHPQSSASAQMQEPSLSILGPHNISLLAPEPLEHSSLQNATQVTPPCLQEVVGSLLSEQVSLGWSPSDHGSLGPLASTLGAGGPSLSEADTIQISASAPVNKAHLTTSLGPLASKYYDQMMVQVFPALHGDLESSQSDHRTLEMTKFAEGSLENLSVAQRTTKLSTHFQDANNSSLSDQSHLLHSPCVKEALIPALSDQETQESLLFPSVDTEHLPSSVCVQMQEPSVSTLGPQDSLLTTQEPLKLSISVCDSLCPFPSSIESETVELSTSSPEYLQPSQIIVESAQGELEYFSTVEQCKNHSSTAAQTTRKLSSFQGCGEHLSSAPCVEEHFQSDPADLATLISSQGPQKLFKLTQGLLHPSASSQESQEPSESSQDVVGTHESSERISGYFVPKVEPVETFTSVSGATVTSPSAPQPLEVSSLLHVTSATSLADQKVMEPKPPSQRTLKVLSLPQGTLKPLASAQENGRNSQLEKDTFSVQGILGSLPCTTGVLQSTPYAHKLPEILPSTKKNSLSPKESLVLPTSANRTLENLQSDHELTKHYNSFQEASRPSLLVQGPLQDSTSASETLRPYSHQGIQKFLLSPPSAVKPSSSVPNANKPLQTTLRNRPTRLSNQRHRENSMSLQGTLGSFSSRSGSVEHSASSPLIMGPPASFQSKLGHLFCTDTSSSFQGPTGPLSFPSGTTGHLQHGTRSHESSLSASKDLPHFLSDQCYISTQGTLASSPYSQQSLQQSASSQEMLGPSKFDQCTRSHLSSVPDDLGMSTFVPLITGTLPQPPMTPGLSSLTQSSPVPSPSLQKDDEFSLSSQATLKVNTSGQETLNPSPTTRVPEKASLYTKPSLSAARTIGALPSTRVPRGHLTLTQGSAEYFPSSQENLEPLQPAQGPLKHFMSSQEMLHSAQSAEETLQLSAPSQAVPEPNTNSPSTQVTSGKFLSVPGHLDLLSSTQVTSLFSHSDERTVETCPSSPGTLKMSKYAQGTPESSASQGTGEFLLSAKGTLGNSISANQTVGPFPSMTEPVRSIRNTQTLLGSLQSGQSSLGVSQGAEGPVNPSLFSQGSLDFSVSAKGTLAPMLCNQGTRKHPASSKTCQKTSQSAQNSPQQPPSVSGLPNPSQSEQSTLGSLSSPPVSSQEGGGPCLSSRGTLEDSTCIHVNLGISNSSTGDLGTSPSNAGTLGSSPSAQVDLITSPTVSWTLRPPLSARGILGSSTSAQGAMKLSSNTQVNTEPLAYAQDDLRLRSPSQENQGPSQFSQGELKVLLSAQEGYKTTLSNSEPVENFLSASGTPGLFNSVLQDAGGSSLSSQNKVRLSTSSQKCVESSSSHQMSLKHPPYSQGSLGTTPSSQGTLGDSSQDKVWQKLSASAKVTPGQSPHHESYEGNILSTQGTVKLSPSRQESLGHSSFFQWSPKSSTSSPKVLGPSYDQGAVKQVPSVPGAGHSLSCHEVLQKLSSSKVTLEMSSSVQRALEAPLNEQGALPLQPHFQGCQGPSQCTPKTSESLPSHQTVLNFLKSSSRSLGTMTPLPATLGNSISVHGALCPCDSDQQIQGSPSSLWEALQFSPSSKGSLGPPPSVPEPLESLLSDQLCPELSITTQESLGLSPHQQGCLGDSLFTQGSLESSVSVQEYVQHSNPDQGTPETSPSSQEDLGLSLAKEILVYSPSSPRCCRFSQTSEHCLGTSPSTQGSRQISSSVHESVEPTPSSQSVPGIQPPLEEPPSPSECTIKASEPLPSYQELYKTLKSISRFLETLISVLESLRVSTSAQGAVGSSVCDQGILESPTFSKETLECSLFEQGCVKYAPCQIGPIRPSLTDQGLEELSSGGKVTLQDSPPQQIYLENVLSTRGDLGLSTSAHDSLGHSPYSQGSLGHSGYAQYSVQPSVSENKILGPSISPEETLELSSLDQGSVRPTPPAHGTMVHTPSENGCQTICSSIQGATQSQHNCVGISSNLQEGLGVSIPVQGSLEHSPSAQGSPDTSLSSQHAPCPCLDSGPLGHSSADSGDVELSDSPQGTPEIEPFTESTLERPPSTHGIIEASPSSQDDLGFPPHSVQTLQHSPLSPMRTEPLSATKEVYKPSRSVSGTLESFPSVPGALGLFKYNQGVLGPLVSHQGNLGPPTSLHNTWEHPKGVQGALESVPSTQESVGHCFSTEFPRMFICARSNFIPNPHKDSLRHSYFPKMSSRHSNKTKKMSRHVPFPEVDIRYSLSELDGLTSFPSVKSSLTSSVHDNKVSSCTFIPERSSPPPSSSDLSLSRSPDEGDLRFYPSPGSTHSKLKKKLRHGSKEAVLKSVPLEDEDLNLHHSSKKGGKDSNSDKHSVRLKTEPKETLTTFSSAKGGCRSSQSHDEKLRSPSSHDGIPRHFKSMKTKLEQVPSNKTDIPASHSEHEQCKQSSLSKIGSRHSSSKRDQKTKATPHEGIEPAISKVGCRSSQSHEEGLRCSPSPQGSPRHSTSTKTKLEQVPSNKADVHVSHSEHEGCKLRSLSKSGSRHSSSKRDQKPKTTPQECIEPSSSKGGSGSSRSHAECGRNSAKDMDILNWEEDLDGEAMLGPYESPEGKGLILQAHTSVADDKRPEDLEHETANHDDG